MDIISTILYLLDIKPEAKRLYKKLSTAEYDEYPYSTEDKGEDMALIEESINGRWKPQYLLDHRTRCAYAPFHGVHWKTLDDDDIDWCSLYDLPEGAIMTAKAHSMDFPTTVFRYKDGIAKVEWQINPDGRYYEDEDDYGATDDEEIALFGYIDRMGKVVEKFTYIPVSTYRYGK